MGGGERVLGSGSGANGGGSEAPDAAQLALGSGAAGLVAALERRCWLVGDETVLRVAARSLGGAEDAEWLETSLSEVVEWSKDLAAQLSGRLGARAGDRVLVLLEDGEHAAAQLVAVLACLRVGALWLPARAPAETVPTAAELARLRAVVSEARPVAAVTVGESDESPLVRVLSQAGVHRVALLARDGSLCYAEAMMGVPPSEVPAEAQDPAAGVYCMYTSGSSSAAGKGVVGTARGLTNRIEWALRELPLEPGELCLRRTPLVFVDAVAEMLVPLLGGGCLWASAEPADRVDSVSLLSKAAAAGVRRATLLPSQLALALPHLPRWEALGLVIVSGEPALPALARAFRVWARGAGGCPAARLVSLYGSTEVAGDAAVADLTEWEPAEPSSRLVAGQRVQLMPLGSPLQATEIELEESAAEGVDGGVDGGGGARVGELVVYGAPVGMPLARFLDPGAPAALGGFFRDAMGREGYRTGDLAFRDDVSGQLYWVGRVDNQHKLRGQRVVLEQAEAELGAALSLPPGSLAAVVDGDRLVLFAGATSRLTTLRDMLTAIDGRVQEAYVPHALVVIERGQALPKTASGKIDRKSLRAMLHERRQERREQQRRLPPLDAAARAQYGSPHGSHVSSAVGAVASELTITLAESDLALPFRALGGDSMTAVKLVWALKQLWVGSWGAEEEARITPFNLLADRALSAVLFGGGGEEQDGPKRRKLEPHEAARADAQDSAAPVPGAAWAVAMLRCVDAGPLLCSDCSHVIVGSHGGDIGKLAVESGALAWRVRLGGRVHATPAECGGALVVVTYATEHDEDGSDAGGLSPGCSRLVELDLADGSAREAGSAEIDSVVKTSPVVDGSGVAWLGTQGRALGVRLGAASNEMRAIPLPGDVEADVLLLEGEHVVVATVDGDVLGLRKGASGKTGSVAWTVSDVGAVYAGMERAVLDGQPVVLVATIAGAVLCLAASTGERVWEANVGASVFAPLRLCEAGLLVGAHDGRARLLSLRDGSELWSADLGSAIVARPAVTQSGRLAVVASTSGRVRWLEIASGGRVVAETLLPGEIFSSPVAVGGADDVVIGCRDNVVRRLSPALACSETAAAAAAAAQPSQRRDNVSV